MSDRIRTVIDGREYAELEAQLATVTAERDEARRERDELRKLLKRTQDFGDYCCFCCRSINSDGTGHKADCELAAAINTEGKQG